MSDSEGSRKSTPSESGGSSNDNELSLIEEFDDLMICMKQLQCGNPEETFLHFVEQTKIMLEKWIISEDECVRLHTELDKKIQVISELECQLKWAQKLIDKDKKHIRKVEKQLSDLGMKMDHATNIIFNHQYHLPEDIRQKLAFLKAENFRDVQNFNDTIGETNLTGSLISDCNYTCSEDDLDTSILPNRISWKIHQPSVDNVDEPVSKHAESSKYVEINTTETVRATTTLTVAKDGPVTVTSIIESIPNEATASVQQIILNALPAHLIDDNLRHQNSPVSNTEKNMRQHSFQTKTLVIPECCTICSKRIRFGKTVFKCIDCHSICHPDCKELLALPCVPSVNISEKGLKQSLFPLDLS